MNTTDTLNQAQELVRAWASDSTTPELNRVDARIAAVDLLAEAVRLGCTHLLIDGRPRPLPAAAARPSGEG